MMRPGRCAWVAAIAAAGMLSLALPAEEKPAEQAGPTGNYPIAAGPFQPTWESLSQYQCPDWFRDAKFGIWAHWGPNAVPDVNDPWYARNMYIEGSPGYQYHVKTYGHPSRFGYKDVIPLWKAEKWDPDRLMALYKRAGAKYFTALALYCDNFDNWNSKFHAWNAVKMGPKQDIVGRWKQAADKAGLRFGVSDHGMRAWNWFNTNKGADTKGPLAGVPYDGNDPRYADLYFEPHAENGFRFAFNPPESWKQDWFTRIQDLIDSYRPDLVYFDGGIPFGDVGRRMAAHFYNQNVKWHAGRLDAVFNIKNLPDHGDFRADVCVEDMERGVMTGVNPRPWQTDTCIGNWFYCGGVPYKPVGLVIQMLADIVSKNGNLLLSIPIKSDGTLDEREEKILADLGAWMALNGEAIYGTRPWETFGEGPGGLKGGHFNERQQQFTAGDIRFTTKGGALYAICLGWPEKQTLIASLPAGKRLCFGDVGEVRMLGVAAPLKWSRNAAGLTVEMPEQKPCEHAVVLKITAQSSLLR